MTRDERIRCIFRKRRRFARKDAAKILGRSERWVEENRFEAERGGFLAWEEVVLLSYFLWTRVQIHRALGEMAARVFPRLAQLVELTIRIPHDKAIALRYEARRRGVDTSEIVAGGIDVFREEAEEIETECPDYMEAWHFPYERRRREGNRLAARPRLSRARHTHAGACSIDPPTHERNAHTVGVCGSLE